MSSSSMPSTDERADLTEVVILAAWSLAWAAVSWVMETAILTCE